MATKQPKSPRAAKPTAAGKATTAKRTRPAPAPRRRLLDYALGAASIVGGALLTVFVARKVTRRRNSAEHIPTDLLGDIRPAQGDRALDAFRPDPTAPVPVGMRESLRPATGPAPTLVAAE